MAVEALKPGARVGAYERIRLRRLFLRARAMGTPRPADVQRALGRRQAPGLRLPLAANVRDKFGIGD
ncbi:hypothetical protein SBA6_480009 [Candidatus Sulfopaludibacter sp. SbA6]|nr:hypothetical protein SBA6_480009 [Candidatus Sulfopaludibacter sp. SbA6]